MVRRGHYAQCPQIEGNGMVVPETACTVRMSGGADPLAIEPLRERTRNFFRHRSGPCKYERCDSPVFLSTSLKCQSSLSTIGELSDLSYFGSVDG